MLARFQPNDCVDVKDLISYQSPHDSSSPPLVSNHGFYNNITCNIGMSIWKIQDIETWMAEKILDKN